MSKNWHSLQKNDALKLQETDLQRGLTQNEAELRLQKYGANKFAEKKKERLLVQVLRQFKDVAVIVLLIAVALSFVMAIMEGGGYFEPIIILAIVVMNTVLAVTQERGAEKALEALSKLNSPTCFVIRDGIKTEIPTEQIAVGDIIVLKTGDLVPADARLIESESFAADESSLTGESEPSQKDADAIFNEDASLGDRKNMVFMGCLVARGHAKAVVVETGMNTQIGKIAGYLNAAKKKKTPLQIRLDKLGKMISAIAICSAFVLLAIGLIEGQEPMHLFMLTVTLAVAAVPEMLMLIVTLMLTHGVKKMVGKNALIRKLQAVETLGSTSVICSDKTGTLTQNKMSIRRLWVYGEDNPCSEADANSQKYMDMLRMLLLASNVTLENDGEKTTIIGDPTETAIMRLCMQKGIDKTELESEYERVMEIPFSSSRKMMTTVIKNNNGKYMVITKGAFDRLPFDRSDLNYLKMLEDKHNSFADDALRVLSVATKEMDEMPAKDDIKAIESGLTFRGIIGIIDPPRPEVAAAIARAKHAGIRTVMITGDHAATASAIARELGIITAKEGIITGQELAKLSDDELFESVEYYSVYARVTPEDKIRIVQAWQRRGEVVSMTGDGVNDAPALKAADVGVSMGINGTEVAKSASDMILTDDNFTTIVEAVSEGRNVFSNIRKLIYFLIVCNISEVIIMLLGQISGWGIPVTPIMLLLVNLLGDGIPGIALAKEGSDARMMNRKPINKNESFFSGGLIEVIIRQTIVCSLVVLVGFFIGMFVPLGSLSSSALGVSAVKNATTSANYEDALRIAQTMAFLILGWTSVLHIFTVRSRKSIFLKPIKENAQLAISALIMLIVLGLLPIIPWLNDELKLIPLSWRHWLIALGLSLIPTLVAEYGKFWDNYKLRAAEKSRVEYVKNR